ncbi:MAG: hypothetical protein OEZ38_05905 [Gammaproteobacteria bacterium]|nr:hypothetical protein [Gammaproteobacteria bacterium]
MTSTFSGNPVELPVPCKAIVLDEFDVNWMEPRLGAAIVTCPVALTIVPPLDTDTVILSIP